MVEQIPLSLSPQEHATFENFHAAAGSSLVALLQSMKEVQAPSPLYLWGATGVGKSHLLNALCHWLGTQQIELRYLPLKRLSQYSGKQALSLLDGGESYSVVVVDDIDAVVGDRDWEELLFHLINQARDREQRLLISGTQPVAELGIQLADLRSRMGEAVTEHLEPLSAEEKWGVLQQRAAARGMKISDEVVTFLIHRTGRDFHTLFELLERMDRQSLIQKRKITIPFVKELLNL